MMTGDRLVDRQFTRLSNAAIPCDDEQDPRCGATLLKLVKEDAICQVPHSRIYDRGRDATHLSISEVGKRPRQTKASALGKAVRCRRRQIVVRGRGVALQSYRASSAPRHVYRLVD